MAMLKAYKTIKRMGKVGSLDRGIITEQLAYRGKELPDNLVACIRPHCNFAFVDDSL